MFKNKLAILLLVLIAFACQQNSDNQTSDQADLKITQIDSSPVLARVNGSPITEYELELLIDKTIGQKNASQIDAGTKKKILDSLIASRAIAIKSENQISEDEKLEITKKTKAYREQLLVKKYLAANTTPQPVTQEMVKDYYNTRPDKFGAKTIRTYEMISISQDLTTGQRDKVLAKLKEADGKTSWNSWADELKKKGLPVFYKKGDALENLLHPKINNLIKSTGKGQTSKISFVDKKPCIVRVIDIRETPPRPLPEVSTQIRKMLVPVQLKKAVKQMSADVLKTSDVEYMDETKN